MITNQIIQNCITDLKNITRVDLCVKDLEGITMASTFEKEEVDKKILDSFRESPADSQVIGENHLLKVFDEDEVQYIVIAKGPQDSTYMVGKIAVSELQSLIVAYKERYDRNNFFQNLILDNMLLVDIYNRAKKLRIDVNVPRSVFLIEIKNDKDNSGLEILKGLFTPQNGDYITAVDEKSVVLIKSLEEMDDYEGLEQTAKMIVDVMNTEAMMNVKVSYGNIVGELKEVSKSYKEAKMAMDVGRIFYAENDINAYKTLGIGRLIYQLPINLCQLFIEEIFGAELPEELDEENLATVQKFFDNNLNVSETSRQLFVHRNTLVYRIEKIQKATGLDVRTFDDALTFKIAMMVVNYMKYLDSLEY